MTIKSQENPKGGKKVAKVRAFRPTHSTAKHLLDFEEAERREGTAATEYLVEIGLAVWLANDLNKYRLTDHKDAVNV